MKILVTGATGYIGSVLTHFLSGRGHDVVGFDTNWFADCRLYSTREAATVRKDLRHIEKPDLENVDAVCHLAGLCNDPLGAIDEQLTHDINVTATRRLAELAIESGVRRFVFSSSCSLYGAAGESPVDELAAFNPQTAYAKSKVDVECLLSDMASDWFVPTFLRNATVYGASPRIRLDVVLNNLLASAVVDNSILVLSDGTPWRPLVHILDVCFAFALALESDEDVVYNQAFNVGFNQDNYRVSDIANLIAEHTGVPVETVGQTAGDTRSYRVDFTKIQNTLHLKQHATAPEWLRSMVPLYKSYLTKTAFEGHLFNRLRHIQWLLKANRLTPSLFWKDTQ
jgi:nucleoside-diphosphate-sugar epimerase